MTEKEMLETMRDFAREHGLPVPDTIEEFQMLMGGSQIARHALENDEAEA